jgi:biopolymer transport protein ExbB
VPFQNPSSERPGYLQSPTGFLTALLLSFAIATPAFAQTAETAAPPSKSLWNLIAQGGWAMWPLGLCSLIMFFLIYHTWRETKRPRFVPDPLLPQLRQALAARDVASARQMITGSRTVLASALGASLQRARPAEQDAGKAHIEASLAETLEVEDGVIGQWINYLNVVATVAPMIGLLGTVSGMIGAFQTISTGGMGRPELLAGDIGEALITTATGLVIGIPAMVAYFVMRNRLANQMTATAQTATDLIDTLSGETQA